MEKQPNPLNDFLWGIERETHRIHHDGSLSERAHPESLGAPSFTKDFAETQLELVTKPHPSIEGALEELAALTQEAERAIGDELLWPFSMPPALPAEGEIHTARMGNDENGRLAERYRRGLAARYGSARQMICGLHVNVSFGPALLAHLQETAPLGAEESREKSTADGFYLRLARNLIADMPLFVRAFGASPTQGNAENESGSEPAFSYRNSPTGYARTEYRPYFYLDSIASHIAGIRKGLSVESAAFTRIPLVRDGKTVQVNARVFQREKEFYAPVRFRRTATGGESPLGALERKGVQYAELRFFDIDPFSRLGIAPDALRLAHLFILEGLMRPSTPITKRDIAEALGRADRAALRNPFAIAGHGLSVREAARLDTLSLFADSLGTGYARALERYRAELGTPCRSASARLVKEFRDSGLSWTRYGGTVADKNRKGDLHASA